MVWGLVCSIYFYLFVDTIIAAVKPKPPPKHIRADYDDEDDDDLVRVDQWIL